MRLSKVKYWLWLTVGRNLSAMKLFSVIEYFGTPENAWLASEDDFASVNLLTEQDRSLFMDKSFGKAETVEAICAQKGIEILTFGDAKYPDRLRNIPAPPLVLYIRGTLPAIDDIPAVAVVGTRKASPYGIGVTNKICYELAKLGMTVISGLADGIDGAAHSAALKAGGLTLGVIGCGADVVYPAKNEWLYKELAEKGAIISEYPPGTPPEGMNFPVRNRIMSGLALGVLVVEAPRRSGALITASCALEQNRDVFAIPGPLGAINSEGCNELIRDGAGLVTCAQDLVSEYASRYRHRLSLTKQTRDVNVSSKREISAQEPPNGSAARTVFDTAGNADGRENPPINANPLGKINKKDFTEEQWAIIVTMEKGARQVDQIIAECAMPVKNVLSNLTLLEVKGVVRQLAGKFFELA